MNYINEQRGKLIKSEHIVGMEANAIKNGDTLELLKPSGQSLLRLEIQGSTQQNGTPTIDSPIPICSSGDSGLLIEINNDTVGVPSEVMLSNEAIIPLRFAKVGKGRDTLTIDRIDNRVVYKKCVEHIRLGDKGTIVYYKNNGVYIAGALTAKESYAQGYCNRDAVMASFNLNKGIVIGAGTNYVYWLGILDTLGFTDNWVDKSNPTSEEKKQAITDLKNWLAENPTYIYYEQDTPVEYDLTDTELGKALLSIKTPYNQNATLEIASNAGVGVSDFSARYYSLEDEDKLSLRVSYVNENGDTIRAEDEYQIRRGSYYELKLSEINGYTPLIKKYEGYLTENTEITAIYKK